MIALDPKLAEKLRSTLEARHNNQAADIYRMLWGYSESQLADGAAKELVNSLDHSEIDFRVVAIVTLQEITGKNTTYSAAEESPRSRRTAFWRRSLTRKAIKYAQTPEIDMLLKL